MPPSVAHRSKGYTIGQPTIPIFSVPPSLEAFTSHTTTPKQREIPSLIQPTLPAIKSSMIPLVSQKAKSRQCPIRIACPRTPAPLLRKPHPMSLTIIRANGQARKETHPSHFREYLVPIMSSSHLHLQDTCQANFPPSRGVSSTNPQSPPIVEELAPFRSRSYSMTSTIRLPMSFPRRKICIIRPRTFM